MYIRRTIEDKIMKYLKTREIIAVIGPRQSGKTTLLSEIFKKLKKAVFITFEERDKLLLFETDTESFIRQFVEKYDYLFIDEFQYAKEGGKVLKYIHDTQKIKIFISGSSSSELSIQSLKFLVGRIFIFQLNPLSFEEFISGKDEKLLPELKIKSPSEVMAKRFNKYLDEFMLFGGYPRVVTSKTEDEKMTVLKNIYDVYFLKEIKEILGLASEFKLRKLIAALGLQLGGIVNYNELSAITGFNHPSLMEHLGILNKTFITLESRPFFTNKRLELVKAPKFYFMDTGFRNAAIDNFQGIASRSDAGSIRENFVASELVKKECPLRYWRSKSKAEVDFVVEKNGKVIPLEIKSRILQPKLTKSFQSFIEKYSPENAFVGCEDVSAKKRIKKTTVRWAPVYNVTMELA